MTSQIKRRALVVGTGDVAQAITTRLAAESDDAAAHHCTRAREELLASKFDVVVICCLDDTAPTSSEELAELCDLTAHALTDSPESRAVVVVDARAIRGYAPNPQQAALHTGAIGVVRLHARRDAATGATWNLISAGPSRTDDEIPGMVTARPAEPDEIAHAVWVVAAPFSGFMTGTVLAADGGLSLGH